MAPVLRELLEGPRRSFQLRVALAGVQPKVLRETLRFLEGEGVVRRVLHDDGTGTGVAYELTDIGNRLLELLGWMFEWGRDHLRSSDDRTRASALESTG